MATEQPSNILFLTREQILERLDIIEKVAPQYPNSYRLLTTFARTTIMTIARLSGRSAFLQPTTLPLTALEVEQMRVYKGYIKDNAKWAGLSSFEQDDIRLKLSELIVRRSLTAS